MQHEMQHEISYPTTKGHEKYSQIITSNKMKD